MAEKGSGEEHNLTNSLITALRDPAKPILCFVNPQIHRESVARVCVNIFFCHILVTNSEVKPEPRDNNFYHPNRLSI